MFRENLGEIYDSIWPDKWSCVVVSNIKSSNLTNIFSDGLKPPTSELFQPTSAIGFLGPLIGPGCSFVGRWLPLVQVSNPKSYDGGELQFRYGDVIAT